MPHIVWLNISVTGFGSPGSHGAAHICNEAKCIASLVSIHFIIVCFMNFIHALPVCCFSDGMMMM